MIVNWVCRKPSTSVLTDARADSSHFVNFRTALPHAELQL
jgi:hypothetical protein